MPSAKASTSTSTANAPTTTDRAASRAGRQRPPRCSRPHFKFPSLAGSGNSSSSPLRSRHPMFLLRTHLSRPEPAAPAFFCVCPGEARRQGRGRSSIRSRTAWKPKGRTARVPGNRRCRMCAANGIQRARCLLQGAVPSAADSDNGTGWTQVRLLGSALPCDFIDQAGGCRLSSHSRRQADATRCSASPARPL